MVDWVGVEFGARMINIDGKQIKLQIWDTVSWFIYLFIYLFTYLMSHVMGHLNTFIYMYTLRPSAYLAVQTLSFVLIHPIYLYMYIMWYIHAVYLLLCYQVKLCYWG